TNCLIQLLKSVSIKSFVSTEAAHSTAAFQSVKLFLKNFSFLLNRLRFRHRFRSHLREEHSTAFKTAVNHLLLALSTPENRNTDRAKPLPCQPGAF
ncbi:hypothetical protein V0R48_16825, partial [Pseudomonas alcaligenes]|uniref:hypothetical protein n=1 Tax=Aquipseudomonas alcaligenes TaxID=43263 RepID=UPI002E7B49B9